MAVPAPVKPIYGVMDFHAQVVLPMSQNPPTTPIEGSVYIDTDDGRIYAYVGGQWRASRISALPGTGIVFTQDTLGVTTISLNPTAIPPQFKPVAGTGITITNNAPSAGFTTIAAIQQVIPPEFKPVAGNGITITANTPTAGFTTIAAIPNSKVIAGPGVTVTEEPTDTFTVKLTPNEIVSLSLTSPWTAGSPEPQRMRTPTGVVYLRGACTASGPVGKPITTLPSGWRPSVPMMQVVVAGSGQQNIQIDPDGTVTPINGTGSPTRLGGISFVADGS